VKVIFATAGSISGHVKSGRLKGLAVTSAEPSPLVPGLPTVAASGVPGYAAEAIYGFWAPAKTPPAILALLNREAVAVLGNPEIRQRFFNAGVESVGTKPQEFAAVIKSETGRLGEVIKKAGLRTQQ
jgi:tripartite-type tricarboxylate transporter receptor subunit TctC